jgi:hypothetical protein
MRNLKKLLAVIVAVAFVISAMVPAFAAVPSDIDGTDYEAAVTRLAALGVITGREDGKFYPDETISRSEFAAVVVRALGYNSAANAAKGATKFSDVSANYWASGYINLATSLGIINGRPDGTFGPDDAVLYEEAMTMIVRSLGYEPAAAAKGGYPTGYLVIGAQEGINDDAEGTSGMHAPRGLVAKMVDNSLEVAMMIQVGYGTEVKFVKSGTEGTDEQTILDSKLKLDKYEAKVLSVDGDEIEVRYTNDSDVNGNKANSKEDLKVFEAISTVGLRDALVTIWVKDGVIYSLEADSTTYFDFISEVDGEDNTADYTDKALTGTEYEITLKNADASFDVDELASSAVTEYLTGTPTTDDLLGVFAKVVINDGKVASMVLFDLTTGGIIEEVNDDYIKYTQGTTEGRRLRGMDDAKELIVVIDGSVASYSDLKADMLFDYDEFAADKYIIVASSAKAEGELSAVDVEDDGVVEIDGKEYDLDAANDYYSTNDGDDYAAIENDGDLDDLFGVDVVAYLNAAGDIRYIKGAGEETTSEFYGYVLKEWSADEDYLRIFTDKGETVTYSLDINAAASDNDNLSDIDTYEQAANPEDAIYLFTINEDGEITKVMNVGSDTVTTASGDEFDEDNDAIKDADGSTYYVGKAVMFNLDKNGNGTCDDPEIVNWADIENKVPGAGIVFRVDTDNKYAKMLAFRTGFDSIANDDEFVAFVSSKVKADADNYRLTLLNAIDKFTKLIDEDDVQMPAKNAFVVYVEDGADAIDAVASYTWTNETATANWKVAASVYDVDGDFIKFAEGDASYAKFAKDVIVIEVSGASDNNFDQASLSDIANGDSVKAYVEDGIVKAIFFKQAE